MLTLTLLVVTVLGAPPADFIAIGDSIAAIRPSDTAGPVERYFPRVGPFDPLILEAAGDFDIDPFILKGLLMVESRLDPTAGSWRGRGIASFTPAGVAGVNQIRAQRGGHDFERFTMAAARRPELAIPAAAELLAYHQRRLGRDGGIAAYQCPAVGRAVARHGWAGARRRGLTGRCGRVRLSGRYLIDVLGHANRFRRAAGLWTLPGPGSRGAR